MNNLINQFKSNEKNILYKDRFNLVEIENLVDSENFEKLQSRFPNEKYFSAHNDFAMSFSDENEKFKIFLDENRDWEIFISKLKDKEFVNYLLKFFRIKNVYYDDNWKKFLPLHKKVKLSFCFNISKKGGFSLPHTDSSRKLISLVLFFVDNSWSIENGGQINLYKPLDSKYEDNWRNKRIEKDNLTILKTIIPIKNKIYGFKKTKNSYHSVEPVLGINSLLRKVFMINLIYENESDAPYNQVSFFKKINNKIFK